MNFYPHYMGDYARDTGGLTVTEHGAYRLLLDHAYATEEPVPNDLKELYRIVGVQTPAERKAVEKVAAKFFPVNGDGRRHHKRVEEEITKAQEKAAKAKASADARWGNAGASPDAERTHVRTDMRTHSARNASQNHKPERSTAKGADAPSSEPGVPTCPQEALVALYAKHLPMLTQPRLWDGKRAEVMRARWRACAKKNAVWLGYTTVDEGLAFWATFFAGVAQSPVLTEGIKRGDGSSWKPDLPWLLKSENFVKVIEGKYHR